LKYNDFRGYLVVLTKDEKKGRRTKIDEANNENEETAAKSGNTEYHMQMTETNSE